MVDRSFRIGDICQRAGSDDPQPGTVIDARVKAHSAHAISGKEIFGWLTMSSRVSLMLENMSHMTIGLVRYSLFTFRVLSVFC